MSEQILLQGKILGIEAFLLSAPGAGEDAADVLAGRAQWITLLCEALPRALLAELGLARILLGSSRGGGSGNRRIFFQRPGATGTRGGRDRLVAGDSGAGLSRPWPGDGQAHLETDTESLGRRDYLRAACGAGR